MRFTGRCTSSSKQYAQLRSLQPASVVAAAEADRWMPARRTDWVELRGFEPAPSREVAPVGPIALDDGGMTPTVS